MSVDLVVLLGTLLNISLIVVLLTFIVEFNKRQARYYTEKAQMNAQFQEALSNSQLEIQEQTFKTISEEIHDNIGQVLTLVKLNINSLDCSSPAVFNEKVSTTSGLLTKAIQDLRDLSKSLSPYTLSSIGIVEAVRNQLQLLERSGTVHTEFVVDSYEMQIAPEIELILFRVVQEALNNIVKHAGASNIYVFIKGTADALILRIEDDGTGFNLPDRKIVGSGLRNMEGRCKVIGATFQIDSSTSGTKISLELPLFNKAFR